eukprot:4666224-Pleurochrysis_carterae.AAC.1
MQMCTARTIYARGSRTTTIHDTSEKHEAVDRSTNRVPPISLGPPLCPCTDATTHLLAHGLTHPCACATAYRRTHSSTRPLTQPPPRPSAGTHKCYPCPAGDGAHLTSSSYPSFASE